MLVAGSLGSCLGLVVYDPLIRAGGLLHLMLPESSLAPARAVTHPATFVDTGVPALFHALYALGAEKYRTHSYGARAQGEDDSIVFTAGLLHDIGKIILSEALKKNYDDLLAEAKNTDTPLLDIERKILGVDHAQVGGRLLDRWKFPANMVAAVWFHHTPRAAGEHERLASYLNFGNVIAHLLGHTYGHKSMALQGRGEVLKTLGITQADLEKYLFLTVDELSRVESIFNVRSDAAMA